MRCRIAVLITLFACSAACQDMHRKLRPRYPLPTRAKVVVDQSLNELAKDSSDNVLCERFRTTPQQVRRYFNRSYVISGQERHDGIDELSCGVDGRILLDGHTFSWRLRVSDPAGFLETDFPDGRNHMLANRLGDLSDDPQPHRISPYIEDSGTVEGAHHLAHPVDL